MVTTYTLGSYTDLATDNQTVTPFYSKARLFVLKNKIDFSAYSVISDGDEIVEALNIPANTIVQAVWLYVETVDAGITDVDVGPGGAASVLFLDGASFATTGYVYTTAGAYNPFAGGTTPGYLFSSADTIDLLIKTSDTSDTAVLYVYALCVDLTDPDL